MCIFAIAIAIGINLERELVSSCMCVVWRTDPLLATLLLPLKVFYSEHHWW